MRLKHLAFVAFLGAAAAVASAGSVVTYDNATVDQNGTGFGTRLTLLSVSSNNGFEYGSVTWNGSADVLTQDATNQSATHSVAELLGVGISRDNFKIIFNIAESGNNSTLVLHDFGLRFTDSSGTSLFPDVIYDSQGGQTLAQAGNGQGAAGHLFSVTLSSSDADLFFGPTNNLTSNRVAQLIDSQQAITDTSGSAENFYLAAGTPDFAIAVPAPAAAWSGLALLALLGGARLIAKRRQAVC